MGGKMTATMVVDLQDKTGAGVRAAIGNLDRLKKAERDYELAQRGAKLSTKDRALENLLIARKQADDDRTARLKKASDDRKAELMLWAGRGAVAVGAFAAAQVANYTAFAEAERKVNRIAITGDKGFATVKGTMSQLQKVAKDTYLPIEDVTSGLDALVASGRSMEESMAFLPSVAMTAQASGAALEDIARSSDALAGSMGIKANEMQHAFDILVAGGKAGKFELKDMAQYLPSLLPAFSALGYKGTAGLEKMVAMLQIVRNQTGTSGEAATNLANVFQKMETEETTKKFHKMGVDLPKALKDARKSGKDLLDVFLDMTQKATKGDLSKIPLLFGDAEMQKGVRALITQRDALNQMRSSLKNVDGSTLRDFNQVLEDSAAKIQKLKTLLDKLATQSGDRAARIINPVLEEVTEYVDRREAADKAREGMSAQDRVWQQQDFKRRYQSANPNAAPGEWEGAYREALVRVGRKQAKTVFEDIERLERQQAADEGRRVGGSIAAQYPSRGSRDEKFQALGASTGQIPVPLSRPKPETAEERLARQMKDAEERTRSAPSRGSYDPEVVNAQNKKSWLEKLLRPGTKTDRDIRGAIEALAMDHIEAHPSRSVPWPEAQPGLAPQLPPLSVGGTMELDEARRARQAGFGGTTDTLPGKAADDLDVGRSVTIQGTPTVSLSGTPTVSLAGPVMIANMPVPSITMSVVINEASNPEAVAHAIGQKLQSAVNGVQASTSDFGN